ncbi:MAG: hypothetical protein GX948_00840 [Clostridiaceae bacterium]|nr:hypothetical protein [Clostridiaceae bacterium]
MSKRSSDYPPLMDPPKPRGMRVLSSSQATVILVLSLATSRLSGFIREILIAPTFGYGINTDAYYIGFQIPDLAYQLLVGGTFAAAVTPAVSSALARGRERRLWKSLSTFINVFLIAFIILIAIGEILAGPIINLYNPNKDPEVIRRAVMVTRALFPQTLFLFLAGMCTGILTGHKLWQRTAFTTTLYNVVCIFFMLRWGGTSEGAPAKVALGVAISAAINFLYLLFMSRKVIHYEPIIDLHDKGFRRLLRLAVPTLISGTVLQLNAIIQTGFANQFTGAVTSLRHAQTTWRLPMGIFAIAVASVMSPHLTSAYAKRNYKDMRKIYTTSLRRALYYVTPFALLFAVLAEETVEAIFQWKSAIPIENLLIEANLLRIYVPAIILVTIYEIVTLAFYARHVTRLSLVTSVVSLALNPLLSYVFTRVLGLGIYGLPVAFVLNSFLTVILLSTLYRRHIREARPYRMLPYYLRLIVCSLPTVIVALAINTIPFNSANKVLQLVIYFIKAIIIFLTYYWSGLAIRFREALDLQGMIRRFLKLKPVGSEWR